jgi:uncharacterized membrane protein YeaQ/YmgE (transglycosylase-associated protein family)
MGRERAPADPRRSPEPPFQVTTLVGTRDAQVPVRQRCWLVNNAPAMRQGSTGEAIMHLIAFLVFGMFVGLIARAIMPGSQSMGLLSTMLLGVVGSLFGGIVGNLLFAGNWNEPVAAGWIGSIIGSMLLLAVLGRTRRTRLL